MTRHQDLRLSLTRLGLTRKKDRRARSRRRGRSSGLRWISISIVHLCHLQIGITSIVLHVIAVKFQCRVRPLPPGPRLSVLTGRWALGLHDFGNLAVDVLELGAHPLDYVLQLTAEDTLPLLCCFVHFLQFEHLRSLVRCNSGNFIWLQNIQKFTRYERLDVPLRLLKACLDPGPLAAFDSLPDQEVLDLLQLLLRVLVVLLSDRLGAVGLVTG